MTWVSFTNAANWLQDLNALPHVQEIELISCDLGTFPRSLSHVNFTSLTTLDLRGNYINSTIPDWVFNITSLEFLYLGGNDLHGFFPDSVTKLTSLKALDLSGSVFQDGFMQVTHISNLCKLQILCLSSLSGSFPDWLGNIKNLKSLDLSSNSLCGSVPASIEDDLANLSSLKSLDISYNSIYLNKSDDWIPPFQLNGLYMGFCQILPKPHFPKWLRTQPTLDELYLSNAGIKEAFPNWLPSGLRYLYLSDNKITESLHLSHNNLSGQIPHCLKSCTELATLDLGHNNFIGNIPTWIGESLLYLKTLSLRSNAFTDMWLFIKGSELEYTTRQLSMDTLIDLSNNYLSGNIPEELAALNFLNHLNLSYNNLSGRIPNGNQLQTFTDSSIYAGNPNLCGPPLTKNCTLNIAKAGEEEQNEDSSKSRMETLWLYTSITLGFIIGFWAICGSLLLQQTWRTSYFRAIDNMFDKLYVMMVVTVAKYKRKL
ncbi:LRR receptor-like serine threonine-protein kinase [Musa troglodytarum]|uniref:LRR receptor-like serine threonine-protein kinase n=1 Tax=Musa troglodytarum TaxID=320322 RepID=A0A9E7JLC9_9LILI|nr:LRR receptor-like serine threonine-protein kinase [Musa troglodytarum]